MKQEEKKNQWNVININWKYQTQQKKKADAREEIAKRLINVRKHFVKIEKLLVNE